MTVTSRARIILARGGFLVGYRHVEGQDEEVQKLAHLPNLLDGEQLLGIYSNQGDGDESILVTTTRSRMLRGVHQYDEVSYVRIDTLKGPRSKDPAEPTIQVNLKDGTTKVICILGRRGKFLDVFEFLRFLKRGSKIRTILPRLSGDAGVVHPGDTRRWFHRLHRSLTIREIKFGSP